MAKISTPSATPTTIHRTRCTIASPLTTSWWCRSRSTPIVRTGSSSRSAISSSRASTGRLSCCRSPKRRGSRPRSVILGNDMKRVAVVGGGIFGSTAAIYAARSGHDVHLFEKQQNLLQAASGINQYRLHRGYHYPRSAETGRSCREAERSFLSEYADAVISGPPHLYGIAKVDSKVSYANYLAFCTATSLEYRPVEVPQL